jgi:hypothetical protein
MERHPRGQMGGKGKRKQQKDHELERIGVIQMTLTMLDGSRYQSLGRQPL